MARRALLCFALGVSVVGLWAGAAPAGTAGWHLAGRAPARATGWHLVTVKPTARRAAAGVTTGTADQRPAKVASALERDVLANVNLLRRQHGLPALRMSAKLFFVTDSATTEM